MYVLLTPKPQRLTVTPSCLSAMHWSVLWKDVTLYPCQAVFLGLLQTRLNLALFSLLLSKGGNAWKWFEWHSSPWESLKHAQLCLGDEGRYYFKSSVLRFQELKIGASVFPSCCYLLSTEKEKPWHKIANQTSVSRLTKACLGRLHFSAAVAEKSFASRKHFSLLILPFGRHLCEGLKEESLFLCHHQLKTSFCIIHPVISKWDNRGKSKARTPLAKNSNKCV